MILGESEERGSVVCSRDRDVHGGRRKNFGRRKEKFCYKFAITGEKFVLRKLLKNGKRFHCTAL